MNTTDLERGLVQDILADPPEALAAIRDGGMTEAHFSDKTCRSVFSALLRCESEDQLKLLTVARAAGWNVADHDGAASMIPAYISGRVHDIIDARKKERLVARFRAILDHPERYADAGVMESHLADEARRNLGATSSATASALSLADIPDYVPEEQDPNILVRGRWLERGGSAFIVSTAGTGKSIFAMQLALCFAEGRPFAGLTPLRPLRIWIFQTEDSMSRLAIDRADITAELMEQAPDVDWRKTWEKVRLCKVPGKVGAEFLDELDCILSRASGELDAILLNPLLSFIGGQITDGTFVTPFLRGGEINRKPTRGLQFILEKHAVGVLCFHHTPKPPSPNEVKAWMRSPFPEYQGGGSADITNWGRSFVTMMRVPDKPGVVCLTAGKNGAELGWDSIDGAYRRYMAWSREIGVTGRNRHAWRDLDEYELAEVTKQARENLAADVDALVEALKQTPMTWTDASRNRPEGMTKKRFEDAWKVVTKNPGEYGLSKAEVQTTATKKPVYYGLPDAAKEAAEIALRNWKNARRTAN